jgi:hypothetical protein
VAGLPHPFGNLATLGESSPRVHGFASPPHDGFAIIEDEEVVVMNRHTPERITTPGSGKRIRPQTLITVGRTGREVKNFLRRTGADFGD